MWLHPLPRLPFCQATFGASFLALDWGRGFVLLINGEVANCTAGQFPAAKTAAG
ncbi:MAG: hypothetical protein P3X23_003975 [Thermosynechococcus sp. Uc]|uniref:hypothetical protein n=1 Tax=Thermosynechococcus sp. Uc TaxID=3034853 RepID=UPI001A0EB600|nr:hypothetical protein [Thermosynechococcus sp. Uc]MDM7326263.1 hypothetical protein [Thermosynechococcus sp. Uc]HIK24392.1 hypothetical protein [Thermosynechococcus sp. M46_R2017_013]